MEEKKNKIEVLEGLLWETVKKLEGKLSDDLDYGLTPQQFFILKILKERGKCSVTELSEKLEVKPSAITAIIDRMLKNGLVIKEKNKKDKRVAEIKVSKEGKKTLISSEKKRDFIMYNFFSKLEIEEIDSLINIYKKLSNIIEKSEVTQGWSCQKDR